MMRRLSIALYALLVAALPALAAAPTTSLLTGVIATGVGSAFPWKNYASSSFVATVTTGGVSAVNIEASQDSSNWVILTTLALGSSNPLVVGYSVSQPAYPYVRGNVTALSGTGTPTVNLTMYPQ